MDVLTGFHSDLRIAVPIGGQVCVQFVNDLRMDFWANLSIVSVFLLLLTLLYASEQFRKLWFSWFYTIFCTSVIKRGGNAIRAKLFEKLSRFESSDCSQELDS
ncbi:unnamed protein product [Oppiella nova]|uniref:Uncharacterized protein n=1 Tax=Oppiella nova TaxID=334625 RepID=A0A7R9QBG8_9ACAR|nr:unnamed protein product [Oppiella nova]CAG2162372.1 unnamed protein product [Oppiella nova]